MKSFLQTSIRSGTDRLIASKVINVFALSSVLISGFSGCSGCAVQHVEKPKVESADSSSNDTSDVVEVRNENSSIPSSSEGLQRYSSSSERVDPSDEVAGSGSSSDRDSGSGAGVEGASEASSAEAGTESLPSKVSGSAVGPYVASGKKKAGSDVESTLKTVGDLREKSRQAASRKDYGAAFQLATKAWDAARSFPNDDRLKKIAKEISNDLDSLGKSANSRYSAKASYPSTMLIDK